MFCNKCGFEVIEGSKFCKNCGQLITATEKNLSKITKKIVKIVGILLGIFVIILIIVTGSYESDIGTNTENQSATTTSENNQKEIASSVVNIFCPSTKDGVDPTGGSGTILTEDGIILTNSHIVPQDEKYIFVDEDGCLVILPDSTTGQPSEYYWARPIVIPGISDTYDLAYMEIHSAMYDDDEGKYMGTYPRIFPAFDDTTKCRDENVQLGEPVRIYGYPAISGGYSLTITDGIVSSFPGDDLIITSAKISHGNSGGLAVDRYGCMIGVPSMVSSDEYESLGVIISVGLINSFSDEVDKYLEQP